MTTSEHAPARQESDDSAAMPGEDAFDPVLMAVLANRFDGIVREMTNTLLRTGRSAILNTARDFSCSIITADHQLLSAAEGLPIHVIGGQLLSRSLARNHPDLVEGDAFLHNDPYDGGTHHADHSIIVPVFHEGVHVLTAVAKAHQADIGNSAPTTYAGFARDLYEEGAINYPCVKVQRDYRDIDDIIRMSRRRIRVPDQWYGDYLAALGSARVGERRMKEVLTKYGIDQVRRFVDEWFDYSERMMVDQIRRMPAGHLTGESAHDPVPPLDEPVPLKVSVDIDPGRAVVEIDLRDNVDCIDAGYNLSEATALAAGMTGLLNQLDEEIPYNEGSFRRVKVHLRENCVVGIPRHPASASVSTTNIADRVINMIQAAFAGLGDGYGIAEGAVGQGPGMAVISGVDERRGEGRYVNQLYLASSGGPANARNDGWGFFGIPVTAGIMYRDSVEIDERKYPMLVHECRLRPDSEGAGRHRGAPGGRIVYGPTTRPMRVMYTSDGAVFPPRGVLGGQDGHAQVNRCRRGGGPEEDLPSAVDITLEPGDVVINETNGGGGYGPPRERDPGSVTADVASGYVSVDKARDVYRVAVTTDEAGLFVLDEEATRSLRA